MNRRELLKQIALLTGATVAGGELFLSGCKSHDRVLVGSFNEEDIAWLDDVAETIIPKTDTPGAREAEVGAFMALYVTDCYSDEEAKIFREGMKTVDESARSKFGHVFMKLNANEKKELLEDIDKDAKRFEDDTKRPEPRKPHYFTLIKQLVLLGFFTSRPGVTQVLRYNPVPGKYHGCIDYKQGETSWA